MRGSDIQQRNQRYQNVQVDTSQWDKLSVDLEYAQLAKKAIRKEIRLSLRQARKTSVNRLKSIVGKSGKNPAGDPRGAARGVKMSVYRGGSQTNDGGSISILNRKGGAKGMKLWEQKRGGKSGITRKRFKSDRTDKVNSYRGLDRAFILRFLDRGTKERETEGLKSIAEKWHRKKGWKPSGEKAKRGKIEAGNFFGTIAKEELEKEGIALTTRIYKLIEEVAQ